MFEIALYEPEIAPNTGNIMRLARNNGCHLHLIEPMGFQLEEKRLRRAGLDYADFGRISIHKNYDDFLVAVKGKRLFACTTKGSQAHHKAHFQAQDVLLFGPETRGLPDTVLNGIAPEFRIRIPMQADSRSLNLSNAVAIISYEAWRQLDFAGGQ
ncbi:tRNA (cytidine(34)-2'-O)-methyltransferase [Oceanisphaera avium]|uniref:tRNA (cytidine(34)-2'-O)-methyltransferase n=1 Tax=Oceanisphaera avium TaxID=1903694 RepID=A0A1Y0CYB3_9GAMM|nr:tRNA (cytidine(34)-2'-O)-methyltransferase [Oceanisphaera avium]ART80313.1 tRNA (uridine(34)/cytosine(34)/5-carboxymethylaminomethyluridine(34)-2'-O)-methyltransferase TrmL [Oceanisphaera avium]